MLLDISKKVGKVVGAADEVTFRKIDINGNRTNWELGSVFLHQRIKDQLSANIIRNYINSPPQKKKSSRPEETYRIIKKVVS